MSSGDHWTFLAYVLLKSTEVKSVEEAVEYWQGFDQPGCVDMSLHGQPYQHLGLGFVCSVAFLTSTPPNEFVKSLGEQKHVASAAIDVLCGPPRRYALPDVYTTGQFDQERWASTEVLF